jgi:hypothetical protein
MRRRLLILGLSVALAVAFAPGGQDAVRTDAAAMQQKLVAMALRGAATTAKGAAPLRTTFTDRQVNAYFQQYGKTFLPAGVTDPRVTIVDDSHIRARAMVNLDEALQTKKRSWLDPLAWLTGTVEVTAAGRLTGADGQGRLLLDQAAVGGVAVPISVLQQVVGYYTRTPEDPDGFDLTQPFPLPSRIQSITLVPGTATIVQ